MAEGLSKLEEEVRGKAFGFVFAIHNKASSLSDQLTFIYDKRLKRTSFLFLSQLVSEQVLLQ